MSQVRVLVGTKKGAFVLTSDGKRENWDVSRPALRGMGDLPHEGLARPTRIGCTPRNPPAGSDS